MFKGSRIRALAVLLGMILAVQLVLILVAAPVQAASGSITLTGPTSFSFDTLAGKGIIKTTTVLNGGTFGQGATLQFVISKTTTFAKPFTLSTNIIGSFTLPADKTTLSAAKVDLSGGGAVVDKPVNRAYFIAASDDNFLTFAGPAQLDVTLAKISLDLSPTSLTPFPGNSVSIKNGTGYTAGKSVDIFLGAPASPPGTLLKTVTAKPDGTISGTVTLPEVAKGQRQIFALDRDSGLSNGVGSPLLIVPGIRLEFPSPPIIDPKGQSLTVGGYGFAAGATIAKNDISVAGLAWGPSSAATASSAGTFHVSVTPPTSLVTSPLSQGFQPVVDRLEGATTQNLLASSPGFAASSVQLVPVTGASAAVNVGDSVDIAVFSYPANTALSLMMGGRLVKAIMTDGHGAAIESVAIPDLPGSAAPGLPYSVDAVNAQGNSALNKLPLFVQSSLAVSDLAGAAAPLIRPKAQIQVSGTGFAARATFAIMAGGALIGKATTDGLGSFSVPLAVKQPPLSFVTGTAVTVSAAGVSLDGAFIEWASPTVIDRTALVGVGAVGDTRTFAGHDFAPGRTYQVLFNDQPLTPDVVFTATASGGVPTLPAPLSLTVPNLGQGVYSVKAVPLGLTAADATELFVVSKANSVPTLLARIAPDMPSTSLSGVADEKIDFFLFGWGSGEAITVNMVGTGSIRSASALASGGAQIRDVPIQHLPGGSYLLYAKGATAGIAAQKVLLAIGVDFQLSADSGTANGALSFTASGLAANAPYDVLFRGDRVFTGLASSAGDLANSFSVPVVLTGASDVRLVAAADGALAASAAFQVDQAFTVEPSPEALVGQSVRFSWDTGLSAASIQNLVPPIFLSVVIDDASYVTLPVAKADFVLDPQTSTGVLSGAFSMPNAAVGAVHAISLRFFDSNTSAHSQQTNSSGTSTVMTESGAGALISGIDFAQEFALIQGKLGDINVSLSELSPQLQSISGSVAHIQTNLGLMNANVSAINAKVTDIQGNVATVRTDVGTIKTSVSDIGAKVTAIQAGLVTIQTTMGEIKTSFDSINARITTIDGNVVNLQTTVGLVQTDVSAIRPVVTTISGNVATIQTDVGPLQGQITSVSGDVATIKTNVGVLQASVAGLPGTTAVNNILYVAIAAAVLALIGAVGAITAAAVIMRRLAK